MNAKNVGSDSVQRLPQFKIYVDSTALKVSTLCLSVDSGKMILIKSVQKPYYVPLRSLTYPQHSVQTDCPTPVTLRKHAYTIGGSLVCVHRFLTNTLPTGSPMGVWPCGRSAPQAKSCSKGKSSQPRKRPKRTRRAGQWRICPGSRMCPSFEGTARVGR